MLPLTGRKQARLKEKEVILRCLSKILRRALTQRAHLVTLHSHLVKSKLLWVASAADKNISSRVRQMLGNLEDIKDYHKKVFLPRLEEAVSDSKLMRFVNHSLLSLHILINILSAHFSKRKRVSCLISMGGIV